MRSIEIRFEGKVQGVWFRKHTKECADKAGVFGNVRNTPDGSVQCIAEGEESCLEIFLECCRSGPPLAHVSTVVVTECAPLHANSFKILR